MRKMTLLRKSTKKVSNVPLPVLQRQSKPAIPLHPVLRLQQTAGNRAVGQLIQAKLKVGQPGDQYEREADRVADQVMRMPEPDLRRQVEPEAEEEEERIQAKRVSGQASEVSPSLADRIQSLRGGGHPLPKATRTLFESRFGQDFSQVRTYTGAQAAEITRAVNARAFTTGQDIVFGAGQYALDTNEGQRLLAHELTHVVQQNAGSLDHIAKSRLVLKRVNEPYLQRRALPEVNQEALSRAQRGLERARSPEGQQEFERLRDLLFQKTGVREIRRRRSLAGSVTERHLELALRASQVTGLPPETILAFWNQEGNLKLAARSRSITIRKRFSIGSENFEINTREHARAYARSHFLWAIYGLDKAVDLITRRRLGELLGTDVGDSAVNPGTIARHDSKLNSLIRRIRSAGLLPQGLDLFNGLSNSVQQPRDLGTRWQVGVNERFDDFAVILLAGTIGLFAQHPRIAEQTRAQLGAPAGTMLRPEIARIAFVGGPGLLNRAVAVAAREFDRWWDEDSLRTEAKEWADRVASARQLFDAAITGGPGSQEAAQWQAEASTLLSFIQDFVQSQAGRRTLPRRLRRIPSAIQRDPAAQGNMQQWRRLFNRWRRVEQQVIQDWENWADVLFVRVDEWILNARQINPRSLPRWRRLMVPWTRLETSQMAAVKQHLFLLDLGRIFNPPASEEELEALMQQATSGT